MNQIWSITLDDYIAICELAQKNGKKPGESMHEEFKQYMKDKNIKAIGMTELTKKELIKEYKSHDKKILNGEIDNKGNMEFK